MTCTGKKQSWEPVKGIVVIPMTAEFKMEVLKGRSAGLADGADHLPPASGLPTPNGHAAEMRVESLPTSTVVEDDQIAVSPDIVPGPNHDARSCRVNRRAHRSQNIYGWMPLSETTAGMYLATTRRPGQAPTPPPTRRGVRAVP